MLFLGCHERVGDLRRFLLLSVAGKGRQIPSFKLCKLNGILFVVKWLGRSMIADMISLSKTAQTFLTTLAYTLLIGTKKASFSFLLHPAPLFIQNPIPTLKPSCVRPRRKFMPSMISSKQHCKLKNMMIKWKLVRIAQIRNKNWKLFAPTPSPLWKDVSI